MAKNFNELQAKMGPERRDRVDGQVAEHLRRMREKATQDGRKVVMVFTSEPYATIVDRGGTGNWRASAIRVQGCEYVIAARHAKSNVHKPDTEEHSSAFLIGRYLSTRPSDEEDRLVIEFEEYAHIQKRDAWPTGVQNPVAYLHSDKLKAWAPDLTGIKWLKLR